MKNLASFLAILLLMVAVGSIIVSPTDVVATKKSSKRNLTQIPSEAADFPGKDLNALQVRVTKAIKNSIGWYEINGEVINVSNKTFYTRPIVVRMFDKDNGPIGNPTGDIGTTEVPPNTSGTFKILINPDDLLGKPTSYRLTFTGTFQ